MTTDDKLKPLRQQIDAIDAQILDLLNQRAQSGASRSATSRPKPMRRFFVRSAKRRCCAAVAERNPGPLLDTDVQTVFREVMSACRALERRVTVAYLGPVGTFSEQAVYQQFGHAVEGMPCASIDEVFRATEAGTADFGVVPIENSSEGVINRTLDLLLQTTLTMSGEVSINVITV
jgi:chorismate mutase/prephenate dehydratase